MPRRSHPVHRRRQAQQGHPHPMHRQRRARLSRRLNGLLHHRQGLKPNHQLETQPEAQPNFQKIHRSCIRKDTNGRIGQILYCSGPV
jgi:hypothetical protein